MIRVANLEEGDAVVCMIEALHCEVPGGIVVPGERTTQYIRASVSEALSGRGLVLVDDGFEGLNAALLAVEAQFPYDTHLGRTALGLGTYVKQHARKLGLAGRLYTEARRILKLRGFENYLGAHLVTNEQAQRVITKAGFEPIETTVLLHLGDD